MTLMFLDYTQVPFVNQGQQALLIQAKGHGFPEAISIQCSQVQWIQQGSSIFPQQVLGVHRSGCLTATHHLDKQIKKGPVVTEKCKLFVCATIKPNKGALTSTGNGEELLSTSGRNSH